MTKYLLMGTVLGFWSAAAFVPVFAGNPEDAPETRPSLVGQDDAGRDRRVPPFRRSPVVAVLDRDGDHAISEQELRDATASLLTLDRNSDGRLTADEFRPPRPAGPQRYGVEGPDGHHRVQVPFGPPPWAPPGEFGPRDSEHRPEGIGPPGDRLRHRREPPRSERGHSERPHPEAEVRAGPGPDFAPSESFWEGPGRGSAGPWPMGPPNPERFVDESLRFDADADGKLDQSELLRFAGRMRHWSGPSRHGPGSPSGRADRRRPAAEGRPEAERERRPRQKLDRERELDASPRTDGPSGDSDAGHEVPGDNPGPE